MLRGARKLGRIVPDHDRIRRSTVPEPSGRYRPPVVTSCTRSPPRENQPAMVGVELSRPSRSSPQHTTRPILSSPSQPPLTPSQTPRKLLAKPLFSPLSSLLSPLSLSLFFHPRPVLSSPLLFSPLNPSATYPLLSNTPRRCSPHLASPLCHAFQHHPTLFSSPPSHCALAFLLTSCRIALPRFTSPLLSTDHCHSLLQPPVLFCPLSLPLHDYICAHTCTHIY